MIGKDKLVVDTASPNDTDNVGAYLRASDGTLLTKTNNGGKQSLDVNVSNTSIAVTATDLDIRDLAFATDKVDVSGSSVTVSSTDLDIRDLAFATDKVDVSGSSVTVTATNLDIRDLSHSQDSVKIGDGTDFLAVNNDGSINVQISGIDFTYDYAEDSAHGDGDIGAYVLSVRQDTLASSTGASGDYQSFKTDALGRLWMNETNQSIAHAAVSVTSTATDLVGTDLANRKRILIQNADSKAIFVGGASVTAANGIRVAGGAALELLAGPGINVHAITASGTADVRVLELA